MNTSPTRLATVCRLLNEEHARYVVVGAAAMQLWGSTRSTRDIDVLIEPTEANAERVLRALSRLPFGVAAEHTAGEVARRIVTMIGDVPNVDILTRAWNLQWVDASREILVFHVDGVPVPTVTIANLIASKRSGRLQDAADVQVLEEVLRLRAQG